MEIFHLTPFFNKLFLRIITILVLFLIPFSATYSQVDLAVTSATVSDPTGPIISWSVTVKNQGNSPANGSNGVRLRLFIVDGGFSQDFATFRILSGLDAGESYTWTKTSDLTNIPNNGKNKQYTFRAFVDPENEYSESNESNNILDAPTLITLIDPSLIPSISSFTPTSGPANTTVTINGSNFGSSQGSNIVRFGNNWMYATSWSNNSIEVVVGNSVPEGSYTIYVENWNGTGSSSSQFTVTGTTDIKDENNIIEYYLQQNYPNPFNPATTINYSIPEVSNVVIKIYDVLGKEVAVLVNEEKPSGNHSVNFDASGLTGGVYFYRIKANSFVETKSMILMK